MESNEDTRDVKFYPVGFVPRNSPTQTHDQIATTLASCISNPGFLHFQSWIPAFPILDSCISNPNLATASLENASTAAESHLEKQVLEFLLVG